MDDVTQRPLSSRAMTVADLEQVLQIECRAYAFPWTRGILADCLQAGHDCRILLQDGEVRGHAIVSVAVEEAHLLNICIAREYQGKGLGRMFMHELIDRAAVAGARAMFLEARASNRRAIALYASLGFVHLGTRKDYYPAAQGREDAWVMALQPL